MEIGVIISGEENRDLAESAGRLASQIFMNAEPDEQGAGARMATEALKMIQEATGAHHLGPAAEVLLLAYGMTYRMAHGLIDETQLGAFLGGARVDS